MEVITLARRLNLDPALVCKIVAAGLPEVIISDFSPIVS